jgi:hypothetical protein
MGARQLERADTLVRMEAIRAGRPVPEPINLINRRGGNAGAKQTKDPTFWQKARKAANPFSAPAKPGRLRRFGKSAYVAALTAAATEGARQLFFAED